MDADEKKKIEHWFKEIEETGVNLTKWEQDFVESVKVQYQERGKLSEKQQEILERIYVDRTS